MEALAEPRLFRRQRPVLGASAALLACVKAVTVAVFVAQFVADVSAGMTKGIGLVIAEMGGAGVRRQDREDRKDRKQPAAGAPSVQGWYLAQPGGCAGR